MRSGLLWSTFENILDITGKLVEYCSLDGVAAVDASNAPPA